MSFYSSVIQMLNFILLSDTSLLVKLRMSSLELNTNKLLAFQFLITILSFDCVHCLGYIFPSLLRLDASHYDHINIAYFKFLKVFLFVLAYSDSNFS